MNKVDRLEKLTKQLIETYKAKNKDYGDSFSESFEEFGLIAPVVRMNDKMNRIKSLSKKGGRQVKGESLRDSLMDLANYAMMTVVELDQQVEDWKKENFGTIGRPDAFEAAVKDCERESNLENNLDGVFQRIESLDDDKKYYLKVDINGIREDCSYLNLQTRNRTLYLRDKEEGTLYQTQFSKEDIKNLITWQDVNLDDFEIEKLKSTTKLGDRRIYD